MKTYKVVHHKLSGQQKDMYPLFETQLNDIAKEGWELVEVDRLEMDINWYVTIWAK